MLLALTLHRPWSAAVALYGKTVENRTWKPWRSAVGQPLAIHQGVKLDPAGIDRLQGMDLDPWADLNQAGLKGWNGNGVVAVCVLEGFARSADQLDEAERRWFCGPYGWRLGHVVQVGPFACRGHQGLWSLPSGMTDRVLEDAERRDEWWEECGFSSDPFVQGLR